MRFVKAICARFARSGRGRKNLYELWSFAQAKLGRAQEGDTVRNCEMRPLPPDCFLTRARSNPYSKSLRHAKKDAFRRPFLRGGEIGILNPALRQCLSKAYDSTARSALRFLPQAASASGKNSRVRTVSLHNENNGDAARTSPLFSWRRDRDSNPSWGISPNAISSRAP